MKQLVKFNSGNFMKADVVTDSLLISQMFEKEHKHVLDAVNLVKNRLAEISADLSKYVFTEKTYIDSQNRKQKCIELNFNSFMLIVMGYNGAKAMAIKDAYITEFNRMRGELESTRYMRIKGMEQRKELTSAIQTFMKPIDPIVYARITNYCYKKVFGKTAKELKEQYDVKDIESLRSFVCEDKLKEVAKLELKVANWIEDFGFKESQIKEKLGIE